ncbi:MAG: DNA ligase [Actinobacteria bacterium]|nr:MAG: DNA ligase [Actinomycetota bacterium]
MPRHLSPMKARTGTLPTDDERWGFEVKWDGVRAIAYVDDGGATFESRNLLDLTPRYPELAGLAAALAGRRAVLDGEIVAFDDEGRPSFQQLQSRLNVGSPVAVRELAQRVPVCYVVFDVVWLDGDDLTKLTYEERRRRLEELALNGPAWQTPAYHPGDGEALLEATRERGLEGVMAKRLDSTYTPGRRSPAWVKVKNVRGQELVVGGWCPGEGRRENRIGSLMLGHYDGDRLRYAGNVGTGFTEKELDRLATVLEPLRRSTSPFDPPPGIRKRCVFVEPEVVVEVAFNEWTRDGTLRQPSYKGQRIDKNPLEVVREEH